MEWIIVFALALWWDTMNDETNARAARLETKKELEKLGIYSD